MNPIYDNNMEEQECEIIFVSKESRNEKNILEALAAYKIKNQPEQQHNLASNINDLKAEPSKMSVNYSTTLKPGVSNQTSEGKKGKKIGVKKKPTKSLNTSKSLPIKDKINLKKKKKKLMQEYLRNSEENEKALYLKNDFEVAGITEYVSQRQGFSAEIKSYYYDFQIHEISLDGSIAHLTKTKNSDLTSLLKPYPTDKGKLLTTSDQSSIVDMSEPDNREPKVESFDYVQFVLYVENKPTKEAINTISNKLRKNPAGFMVAESKSAERSIISQMASVKKKDCIDLRNTKKTEKFQWKIGNFSLVPKPLELGDLKGNHFTITLRKVIGDKCHIEENLKSLEDLGFINYYESQEFGSTCEVPKHLIGKQMMLKLWQEAIDLILEPPKFIDFKFQNNPELFARLEYKSSRDVHTALSMLTNTYSITGQLLFSMGKCAENPFGTLKKIPFYLRRSYIRAYQCLIWNKVVSKRLAKFGTKLIAGDLVYAPGYNRQNNNELLVEIEGNRNKHNNNVHHNQEEVIFIDENNIHKYTIYDVVLPLPQHKMIYPANEVADWYKDFLLADGVSKQNFNQSLQVYGLDGAYRRLMLRPTDLKWKFIYYNDPAQRLTSSDLNRLQQIGLPPVALQGGTYLGLVLEFSLPTSAFATMALREILKMDKSADLRDSIEEAQIKEKPCTTTEQPLSETSNSFLDTNQNLPASATSKLSQASPFTKIKLESSTIENQLSIDSLVEQPTNHGCPSSTGKPLKMEPATIENLPPVTREAFEDHEVKKEPSVTNNRPGPTAEDSTGELQKNQIILEFSTYQRPQLTVNECLTELTAKSKEDPGISQTRSPTFFESCEDCEEPAEKKIKIDPDTDQEEVTVIQSPKVSKFKCITYIDLSSDQDD